MLHIGLRTAWNSMRTANVIWCVERLRKSERSVKVNAVVSSGIYMLVTTKGEANTKGRDTASVGLVTDDV